MAYISFQPKDYFKSKIYTGNNSSSNAITGVGFQPDWTWIKGRNYGDSHRMYDSVRGAANYITPNATVAQSNAYPLTSFDSDGFTIGSSDVSVNGSYNYVSWNWKAGTTSGIDTTGADITPSSYTMSSTAGISIVKFTGNGVDGAKIAHGLGAVPELIISKRLDSSNYWAVFHKVDVTDYLVLNTSDAFSDAPLWKDTMPTSVYYQTDSSTSVNASGDEMVAYSFKSVKGFSQIGNYTGSGNSNGPFLYTGFKPAFLIAKRTDGGSESWIMLDNGRDTFNITDDVVFANLSQQEESNQSSKGVDFCSNGIKLKSTDGVINGSGLSYIYMAFAEHPLVSSNNIPATAR